MRLVWHWCREYAETRPSTQMFMDTRFLVGQPRGLGPRVFHWQLSARQLSVCRSASASYAARFGELGWQHLKSTELQLGTLVGAGSYGIVREANVKGSKVHLFDQIPSPYTFHMWLRDFRVRSQTHSSIWEDLDYYCFYWHIRISFCSATEVIKAHLASQAGAKVNRPIPKRRLSATLLRNS